jgi:ABC-type transporter Mla maintaining outer membrane lipid asymmetry ATPase subunit MlaF
MATPTSHSPSRDASANTGAGAAAASEVDAPVIVFEGVDLAFDEKVILKNLSFTIRQGHTKIFLGASGAGKSTILKLILGLLKPDAGAIWVKGQRVDQMREVEMMKVRGDLGMVFQEGALFDSLTVRENVGYKLYEETDLPLRGSRRCSASSASPSTSTRRPRPCRAGSAAAWRSPAP